MRRTRTRGVVTITGMLVATLVAGCAVAKSGAPPAAEPSPAQGAAQAGYPSGGAQLEAPPYAQPSQASPAPAPPPPPPTAQGAPTTPATPSASKAEPGGASGRSMAIQSASRDVEQSQRELDVAGSDCRNACRALGSMDRAAGRLCELSRGDGGPDRCEDAKRRVYSARDRVRTSCGTCADGTTVDRAAPIPSR